MRNAVKNKGVGSIILAVWIACVAGCNSGGTDEGANNSAGGAASNRPNADLMTPPDPAAKVESDLREKEAAELAGLNPADGAAVLKSIPADFRNLPKERYQQALSQLGLTELELLDRIKKGYGIKVDQTGGKVKVELVPPK
jgi:hypothetical protein